MESLDAFVQLVGPWLEHVELPKHLWGLLYEKLKNDVFDSGDCFAIAELQEEEEESEGEESEGNAPISHPSTPSKRVLVTHSDVAANENVWLVDHAWTFKYREGRQRLCADANLRRRIATMLAVPISESSAEEGEHASAREAQHIFESLWKIVGSYRPAQGNRALQDMQDADHDSIWYVMDEVGSAVVWSCDDASANVKIATMPVCFPEKGCVFSIMWVVKDMEASDVCTAYGRYSEQSKDTMTNASSAAASMVLFGDLLDAATAALNRSTNEKEDETRGDADSMWERCVRVFTERSILFQERSDTVVFPPPGEGARVYPPLTDVSAREKLGLEFPIPFFTDSNMVVNGVTDAEHFRLVAVLEEAKIVWMAHYIMHRSDEFAHAALVSQMSEERFFTNKKHLASLIQKRCGTRPWFQATYDASTELDAFIADFVLREHALQSSSADRPVPAALEDATRRLGSLDGTNLWIAKPCNLARSIDMTVSNNLPWLLRVAQTSPKIFCKYIANPATLRGRKFDLRFVLAVRSLHTPETDVEAYLYNVFWTRFASEQYSLDCFDVYAKHWTVMNYADPDKLLQLHYDAFIPEFNAEYALKFEQAGVPQSGPDGVWATSVLPKIKLMLREMLECIEPDDISHHRLRGSYGVDVMLREELDPVTKALVGLEPVLLEVTFSPDCTRACKYHPSFFNDVFQTLFLGTPTNMTRV